MWTSSPTSVRRSARTPAGFAATARTPEPREEHEQQQCRRDGQDTASRDRPRDAEGGADRAVQEVAHARPTDGDHRVDALEPAPHPVRNGRLEHGLAEDPQREERAPGEHQPRHRRDQGAGQPEPATAAPHTPTETPTATPCRPTRVKAPENSPASTPPADTAAYSTPMSDGRKVSAASWGKSAVGRPRDSAAKSAT
ncbi:hypothetical protein SGRIM119S_03191 [Streptomyces griseorubiginosus]